MVENNSLETASATENYAFKLKTALDLILNDLPDHQDDTIMTKCLDSLKLELNKERDFIDPIITNTLQSFLLAEVLDSQMYRSTMLEKETEIIQFFFSTLAICVEEARNDYRFLTKILEFLKFYFTSYFETQFVTDPTICCSVLSLIFVLYKRSNLEPDNQLPIESVLFFNQDIIDKYLFSTESLKTMLAVNCKSIFVRKSYKQLLNMHLIHLVDQKLKNAADNSRLNILIENLSEQIPIEIKIHNLDITSDLFEHFLFNTDYTNETISCLSEMNSKINAVNYEFESLLNCENLIHDASIESLANLVAFNTFLTVFNLQSTPGTSLSSEQVNEKFNAEVIRICNYFAKSKDPSPEVTETHLFILFKKSSDILFKFLTYFYSFITKLSNRTHLEETKFSTNLTLVKNHIKKLSILPLTININSNVQSLNIDDSYLKEIASKPFKFKQCLIKQCLVNLKLFIRKFSIEIFQFLDMDQVVYLLRHFSVDYDTKNMLLGIMLDYFNSTEDSINLALTSQVFLESFMLKINDSFNGNMLELIGLNITKTNHKSASKMIIEVLLENLSKIGTTSDKILYFSEQFEILLNFLIKILRASEMNLPFVNETLVAKEHFVLKICAEYVSGTSSLCKIETLDELEDVVYQFYQELYASLNKCNNLIEDFNDEFISLIETKSHQETEAFIRRESIKFQMKYHLYQFESHLKTERIDFLRFYKTLNHFAHFLINDFDWQVQMYCLEFIQSVFTLIFSEMEKSGYKKLLLNLSLNEYDKPLTAIETVCFASALFKSVLNSIDDYDQHVVHLTAKILLDINQNQKFISLLEMFNKKDSAFWSQYTKSLGVRLDTTDDISNHLNDFLGLLKSEKLPRLFEQSTSTTDIYSAIPVSILDDIISSYRFDLEDEKHIDCY